MIELLVVLLVIGLLAAIALPTFLGQTRKGQDADAKSNARNVVGAVEACHAGRSDYASCDTSAELQADESDPGPAIGAARGQVEISGANADGYTIVARSRSGNDFTIARTASGTSRSCSTGGSAGCPTGGSW